MAVNIFYDIYYILSVLIGIFRFIVIEKQFGQIINIPDFIKKWAAKRSDAIEKEEADALQDALQDSVESAQPQAVQMEPGV